ncbi:MAG: DUF4271 domain-containing protein [Bacteroidales bacterium]|jgi:hypothetical protein|nr:DUF4271 domain-containing protein [Bacteroidales bacterium]
MFLQEKIFSLPLPLFQEAFLPAPESSPLFITLILSLSLMSVSMIMGLHPYRLTQMLKAIFVKGRFSQLLKDNDSINEWLCFYLLVIICFIEALAFYCIINYLHMPAFENFTHEAKYYIGFSFLIAYNIIYFLSVIFVNWLFDRQHFTKAHIFNDIFHRFIASAFIYPLLAVTCYNPKINLSILILLVWALVYILLIYRKLILYIKNIGLFHFFLYFCTIEILLIFVMIKLYFVLGK